MTKQAKRIDGWDSLDAEAICYWKDDGHWMINFPEPDDLLGNLSNHTVEEHGDGTITVTPSILVQNSSRQVHGYLTKGVWSKC